MPLAPLSVVDTRHFFRPVSTELVSLLRRLTPEDWQRQTTKAWVVRDVVAHLIDGAWRRISAHRDGLVLPPPPDPIRADREFVGFINAMNAEGVSVGRRYSPPVLTEMYAAASSALADFFESISLDGPGRFGVSWAGEETSPLWFDVGREFTELWHHQAQIRGAVGAPPITDSKYVHAVLAVAVRGVAHAYRHTAVKEGTTITVKATGPAGGTWTIERDEGGRWRVWEGTDGHPTARITIDGDDAIRLWFNGVSEQDAPEVIQVEGRLDLARPFLRARTVIV